MNIKESNKVKNTILGHKSSTGKYIKTFAILSAENPINYAHCEDNSLPTTLQLSAEENNKLSASLKSTLSRGVINNIDELGSRLAYSKILGMYGGSKEHSIIVFNVGLETVKKLCKDYNQESFIYGIHNDDDTIDVFTYVAKINCKQKKVIDYIKSGQALDISIANDESEFFTQKNNFKFSYVFPDDVWDSIWECYDTQALELSLNENVPGSYSFRQRVKAFKPLKESNKVARAITPGNHHNKYIKTFAIMTAENPLDFETCSTSGGSTKQLSAKENFERMKSLKRDLGNLILNYTDDIYYAKVFGKYQKGHNEHSIMIFNAPLSIVKDLCASYGQESFIFGVRDNDGNIEVSTYTAVVNCNQKKIQTYNKKGVATGIDVNIEDEVGFTQKSDTKFSYEFPEDAWDSVWECYDITAQDMSLRDDIPARDGINKRKKAYKKSQVFNDATHIELKESNKATKALFGDYYNKIRAFTIITAENPFRDVHNGISNSERTSLLKQYLKDGHFNCIDLDEVSEQDIINDLGNETDNISYAKVSGSFGGTKEHSFMIFNISLESSKDIAKTFGQYSFFYGKVTKVDNSNNRHTSATIGYYVASSIKKNKEGKEVVTDYQLNEESRDILSMEDALDNYSKHKGYKYQIQMKAFENLKPIENENALQLELSNQLKGSSKYYNRLSIYNK